jgi:hypothetical protein
MGIMDKVKKKYKNNEDYENDINDAKSELDYIRVRAQELKDMATKTLDHIDGNNFSAAENHAKDMKGPAKKLKKAVGKL